MTVTRARAHEHDPIRLHCIFLAHMSGSFEICPTVLTVGLVTNTFQAVDFTRWQRNFLTNPALQYRVATLLTNIISCIRGTNMIAQYFQSPLPTLSQYLQGHF
jgi:hypothetical protein